MAIDGTYTIEVTTPVGKLAAKIELKTENGELSGIMESPMGTNEFSGGTYNGNDVSWQTEIKIPLGKIKATVNGTIDGDNVSGEVETGSFGSLPFSGKRV